VVAVKSLSIAVDAYRLISEPLTSGAIYASELTQALSELPEVRELYLFVPSKPHEDFTYKPLLQNKKVKFIYPGTERFPARKLREQLHWIQIEIPSLIRNLNLDIDFYIAPYHHPPVLLPKRIRVVTIIHDLCGLGVGFPKTKKAFYHHVMQFILSGLRSDTLIPISEFTKEQLQTRIPFVANRVTNAVYNSVTTQHVDSRLAEEVCLKHGLKKFGYFLGFGAPNARKGFDVLFDAYGLYRSNGGKAPLALIAAARYRPRIEELIKEYSLSDVLIILDVDFQERDALYKCALALLFPSRCEGFGYPLVEAMRQGCPPIAWQNTPAREIVGGTVPLLKSLDPAEVADQMHSYESLTGEERKVIADSLVDRSFLFDGTMFGRNFFDAMTRGWQ